MAVPPYASTSSAAPSTSSSSTLAADLFPPLHTRDVLACQFSSWYSLFKRVSPKATVLRPIPNEDDFLDYLESDGLFLPEGSGPMGLSELSDSDDDECDAPADPSASSQDSDDDDDGPPARQFSFPHLDAEIRAVIQRYDGAVFPKLNWSSPQDAAWMIPGQSLKCQTPADVYLLLKSSDFISHDLDHAFDDCVDHPPAPGPAASASSAPPPDLDDEALGRVTLSSPSPSPSSSTDAAPSPEPAPSSTRPPRPYTFELVLKKWFDMPGSQQWRCFVRDHRLLGISQRDTTFYDFLQAPQAQRDLRGRITRFWEDEVRDKAPLSSYVLDVYLTRDASRVFVVDLNPFAPRTDPLLFSYEALLSLSLSQSAPPSSSPSSPSSSSPGATLPELRLITSESQGASTLPRYSHNRYPKDVVDLSEGQSVAEFAREWAGRVAEAAEDAAQRIVNLAAAAELALYLAVAW
ncbi:D123-domain-containing protein [Rhodotorula diobovata]|uniref:D123-domain-containing protein n=1 Tax=Rhodotorula diobovata TaxID=5288 RepID=A0A5C5FP17_9BASI|nr:D123-domain-containing protein [Rhodotorula diobovata]